MKYLNVLFSATIIFSGLFYNSCKNSENGNSQNNIESIENESPKLAEETLIKEKKKTLIIEGKDIWIRDYPVTGEVIMKLNTGDECIILEKGILDTIRDNIDYWYNIKFNDKEGWVYGSQTSVSRGNKYIENKLVLKTLEIKRDSVSWKATLNSSPEKSYLAKSEFVNIFEIAYFGNYWEDYWCKIIRNNQEVWIPGNNSSLIPFSELNNTINNKFLEEGKEFLKRINNEKITYELNEYEILFKNGKYDTGDGGGVIYNSSQYVVFIFYTNQEEDGIEVISYIYLKKDNDLIKLKRTNNDQNNGFSGYLANFIDINNDGQEEFMMIDHRRQSSGYYSSFDFYKLNIANNAYESIGTLGSCSYSEIGTTDYSHCESVKMKGIRGVNNFPVFQIEIDDDTDLKEAYIWSNKENKFVQYYP